MAFKRFHIPQGSLIRNTDAAEALGLSRQRIHQLIKEGKLHQPLPGWITTLSFERLVITRNLASKPSL